MTCSKVERLISAYIDRELSEEERNRVRQHLAMCSECFAIYKLMQEVKSALECTSQPECPKDLWDNVELRLRALPLQPAKRVNSIAHVFSFAKLVVPAALAGTAIAVPLVQMIFGIGPLGVTANRAAPPVTRSAPPAAAYVQPTGALKSREALELVLQDEPLMRTEEFLRWVRLESDHPRVTFVTMRGSR
ncbi:MAG: anti-sigma factor [Firmicutes bacterium]|jgi:anti-sigma factor (TIGR02949 family)|nr:anti-sigma factor [Bacillota bacterium]